MLRRATLDKTPWLATPLCVCVFGGQKARLARIHQSKLAARRAIADGTRRFDEWQRRRCGTTSDLTTFGDHRGAPRANTDHVTTAAAAQSPLAKKDLFELQHFHLLRCLEHTTVGLLYVPIQCPGLCAMHPPGRQSKGRAHISVNMKLGRRK